MVLIETALKKIERGKARAADLEGPTLDFKQASPTKKETFKVVTDACVCFANAGGGQIVLGVSDTLTGPDALLGTSIVESELRKAVHQRTEPPLLVGVKAITHSGARLLVVDVPEGVQVHSNSQGVSTRRVEDECRAMRPEQIARLEEERSGRDWSAAPSGRKVAEVDQEAERHLYGFLRSSSRDSVTRLARLGRSELLRELNLVTTNSELNQAGALLLAEKVAGSPEVLVYQHRKTPAGEADYVSRWVGPILTAFAECLEAVRVRVASQPVTTNSGQQILIEDVPLAAIREALINALVHGDLRMGDPVQIEHSPARFAVSSPGPLVSGITPENILTNGSHPRFKCLAQAVTSLGLAEQLGQGVDRMYRAMVSSGRETPRVLVDPDGIGTTTVSFKGGPPNVRLAKFVAELPADEREDTDALLITYLLCEQRSVTAAGVSTTIQRDVGQTEEVLRRLAHGEAQMIEPTPGTATRRHPNYRFRSPALRALGHAVAYSRRTSSETDRKIVAHVKEYGTVNSATAQRTFDMDVYQARDLLRSLVEREVLVRVSAQTRGKAVKYGPGPRFPG